MNLHHFIYTALASALTPVALPGLWWIARRDPPKRAALAERLGHDPAGRATRFRGHPRLWMHAVSVGEVKAAEAIIDALDSAFPRVSILLTTTTATGQRYARQRLGERALVCYAPLDLWAVVGRFLTAFRPDMLICVETEIWPNWIVRAHSAGIKTVFLNGRVSDRSIRSYMRIRPLLKPALEKVDAFSMISSTDARRIIALGASARRVRVNGNVKMDLRAEDRDEGVLDTLRRLFAVDERSPVFIGGSVRGTEMDILLDVYVRLAAVVPDLLFILAPRHIEKASEIAKRADERKILWQRRTALGESGEARTAPLVILDTIGELGDVYGIATVVFGGASLVPMGGQNVLEAAVWAKPLLFGPFMDDFAEAKRLLEACGGGVCVKDATELTERAAHLLTHPGEARQMGNMAKRGVLANQGAAIRHARVVARLLSLPVR